MAFPITYYDLLSKRILLNQLPKVERLWIIEEKNSSKNDHSHDKEYKKRAIVCGHKREDLHLTEGDFIYKLFSNH